MVTDDVMIGNIFFCPLRRPQQEIKMAASGGSPTQYQGQSWLTWSDKFGLKSDEGNNVIHL